MKIGIFIQARTASARLPGKIYEYIGDHRLIEHVLFRCNSAALHINTHTKHTAMVVVIGPKNDEKLKEFCEDCRCAWFGGDEHDLVTRYRDAAHHFAVDRIVRVTGDCWTIDENIIVDVATDGSSYTCNTIFRTYPEGHDCQACSIECLEWVNSHQAVNREHPFVMIDHNQIVRDALKRDGFSVMNIVNEENEATWKTSIDTLEDLESARKDIKSLTCGDGSEYIH